MNKKIKLTYVISEMKIGGAEKLLEDILERLDKNVYDIYLIVLGEKIENELYFNMKKYVKNIFFCNKVGKEFFKTSFKIIKILRKIKTDVIHIHTSISHIVMLGIILNRVNSRFYTIHSMPEFDSPGIKKHINSVLFNKFNLKAIAISKTIEMRSKEYFNTSNIICIENGIDTSKFNGDDIINRKPNNILHVGRFVDVKNQEILIKSVSKIKEEFKLTFVGDGETLKKNMDLTNKLCLNEKIKFLGYRNDIANIMNQNSIFVLCSKVEGAPISIVEAMSNGMCIIATNVGGISDFIENGKEGFLLNDNIEESLREKIEYLIKNKEEIVKLGKAAKKKATMYDINVCVKKHDNLYRIFKGE
ncbi:glycosyltransferase family 4 protein [Clostridium sp.]|uniref:glycosyltransferase family 4 protein n=1 Tax=Clostridium sp. TaxID=1506 RepID=UPI00262882EC|nr:glycosyltransferase family 4 protein [Clostridium sp.]